MAETIFTNDSPNPSKTIDVLRCERLRIPTEADYADKHLPWLEKVEADLDSGRKRAMTATMDGTPVGVVVYRRNPEDYEELEIRNISVVPNAVGRLYGSFVLRYTEHVAPEDFPGVKTVSVDTKTTNRRMLEFLEGRGYCAERVVDLYDSGKPDVVLVETLESAA